MQPISGVNSPESWLIKVVLPAPLGPMMACSSPASIESVISSEARMPPNRLVTFSICSSGSATAQSRMQTVDAAARVKDDREQQRAKDDLPVFGQAGQSLLQQQKRECTED